MLFGIKRKCVFVVRIIVVVVILITDVALTIFVKILLILVGDLGAIVDVIVNAIAIAVGVVTTAPATAFAGRELVLDNIIGVDVVWLLKVVVCVLKRRNRTGKAYTLFFWKLEREFIT